MYLIAFYLFAVLQKQNVPRKKRVIIPNKAELNHFEETHKTNLINRIFLFISYNTNEIVHSTLLRLCDENTPLWSRHFWANKHFSHDVCFGDVKNDLTSLTAFVRFISELNAIIKMLSRGHLPLSWSNNKLNVSHADWCEQRGKC